MKRKGVCCCDMRGLLSFLILFLLSKKPMHGQELAEEIGRRKGAKPSPGTIYPALKNLKSMGLIKERKEGKNIIYSLTEDGLIALRVAKEKFCRTFMGILPLR
jgi:DNA-binding PadR family transcriptional regulator